MKARWTGLAIGLVVAVLLGWCGYGKWEPGWRYAVRGVDVSHHQGKVDWAALVDSGTAFAYIKATEGADWTDSRFVENWTAAGDTGILRGAYHFFTLCTSGAAQASLMIATVPREPGMLPPAVDLEFGGNCAHRPSVEEFRRELGDFLGAVEHHFRLRPVVYTNADFYRAYLENESLNVHWWLMSPVLEPWGSPGWSFWQYFPGRRAGVEGRVDRNVFRGNEHDLMDLTIEISGST